MTEDDWMVPIGPDYATDEPEFMVEFGRAMAEWGNVEHRLSSIFAAVIQAKDPLIARAAFHSIVGFRDRMQAITVPLEMLAMKLGATAWKAILEEWQRVASATQKASKKRNRIAHMHVWHGPTMGTFGSQDITKVANLPLDVKERKGKVVTRALMRDYRHSFSTIASRLSQFEQDIKAALKGHGSAAATSAKPLPQPAERSTDGR